MAGERKGRVTWGTRRTGPTPPVSLIYRNPELKPTDRDGDRIARLSERYLLNSSPNLPILPLDVSIVQVILFALSGPFPLFLQTRHFGK